MLILGRLTYKYHRLVASSDRPGELPQVEKCVVDDDEEDEEEVRQLFACPSRDLRTLQLNFDYIPKNSIKFADIFGSFT